MEIFTVISSLSTFAAVFVALFLPEFQKWLKKRNIVKIIEKEIRDNEKILDLVSKRNIESDVDWEIFLISNLRKITISDWLSLQNILAEISSHHFLKYSEIEKSIDLILLNVDVFIKHSRINTNTNYIEKLVAEAIVLIKKL